MTSQVETYLTNVSISCSLHLTLFHWHEFSVYNRSVWSFKVTGFYAQMEPLCSGRSNCQYDKYCKFTLNFCQGPCPVFKQQIYFYSELLVSDVIKQKIIILRVTICLLFSYLQVFFIILSFINTFLVIILQIFGLSFFSLKSWQRYDLVNEVQDFHVQMHVRGLCAMWINTLKLGVLGEEFWSLS